MYIILKFYKYKRSSGPLGIEELLILVYAKAVNKKSTILILDLQIDVTWQTTHFKPKLLRSYLRSSACAI